VNDRQETLAPLAWDTECFGFPVARIVPESLPTPVLVDVLTRAQQRGFRLVYWTTAPHCTLGVELLQQFHRVLADRKVIWRRELTGAALPVTAPPRGFQVRRFPKGPASPSLINLAVAAGMYSRFRVDHRFPRLAFDDLYRTWIERSTRREIADAVLIGATEGSDEAQGMITVAVEGDTARIGLIAVAAQARGRGLGAALMRAAHEHMVRRGCVQAKVATQSDNVIACRLYQSAAYRLDAARNVYHFWPSAGDA